MVLIFILMSFKSIVYSVNASLNSILLKYVITLNFRVFDVSD